MKFAGTSESFAGCRGLRRLRSAIDRVGICKVFIAVCRQISQSEQNNQNLVVKMMPWTKETYGKMQWLPIAMGITAVYTFGRTPSADRRE